MPSQRADIGATLLLPTAGRKEAVDFTMSIFAKYITLVYKASLDVSSVQELVREPDMTFLTVRYAANAKFFENSRLPLAQKIYQRMKVCGTVNGS